MKGRYLLFFLLVAYAGLACAKKAKPEKRGIESVTSTTVISEEDLPLPPDNLTMDFGSIEQWLDAVCEGDRPGKKIDHFDFNLTESETNRIISLGGFNEVNEGDTLFVRVAFEPRHMHFLIPKTTNDLQSRNDLYDQIISQLEAFIKTKKFKESFLSKAKSVNFTPTGKILWTSK